MCQNKDLHVIPLSLTTNKSKLIVTSYLLQSFLYSRFPLVHTNNVQRSNRTKVLYKWSHFSLTLIDPLFCRRDNRGYSDDPHLFLFDTKINQSNSPLTLYQTVNTRTGSDDKEDFIIIIIESFILNGKFQNTKNIHFLQVDKTLFIFTTSSFNSFFIDGIEKLFVQSLTPMNDEICTIMLLKHNIQ